MQSDLILGDCLEKLKDIESQSVDCIVTSPPYWNGFEYEAYFNSYKQYLDWSYEWLKECKRVLKKSGTMWLNISNDVGTPIRATELLEVATIKVKYKLHDTIIWYKYNQQPANTNRQLTNQCEFIYMLRHTSSGTILNKEEAYNRNPHIFKTKNVGNVWEIPSNNKKTITGILKKEERLHSSGHCGFPDELPETCIILSTDQGGTVLDPFMGLGSVGVACKKLNRNFIGIELDEKIYNIACDRINSELVKKSLI